MQTLASYFHFDEGAPRGAHTHYEWFEGNDYIERSSVPLVISVG
jgi:hypothetical protein